MGRPVFALVVCLFVALVPAGAIRRADEPLIQVEDAYVSSADGGWSIGNGLIRYTIGGNGGTPGIREITDPTSGRDWHRSDGADGFVTINGQRIMLGGTGLQFDGADVSEWWGGVKLEVKYRATASGARVTRVYACYPGSSVIESWTTFNGGPRAVTVSDLTSYAFSIQNGTLQWITGLQTDEESGGKFTRADRELEDGESVELGSDKRSSEHSLPWFSVKAEGAEFFGSVLWSGAWRFRGERHDDSMSVQIGLPSFTTTLAAGGTIEMPHAIFGLTNPTVPDTSIALRAFVDLGIRHGRQLKSFISYNTWYSFGTFIDAPSLMQEMESAAAMGVEQFVVDAGWWFHINPDDSGDFSRGLGTWQVDPERFPDGLGALSDRAHELGMRFGVWVEPERVSRETVGQPGLAKERFLAMTDGHYSPGSANEDAPAAQICLADTEARTWVLQKLVAFIDEVRPDYLKWDNNSWINCNRTGHGHGTTDANFLHHQALESVLNSLRERFPELDIENCASGGNRLSLGLLRYTDAAWVDDRTDPSSYVRHNLEGLLGMFPGSYLLTFVLSTEAEPLMDGTEQDVSNIVRSRMSGAFGFSLMGHEMGEGTRAAVTRDLDLYKLIRPILQNGAAVLLSPQVSGSVESPLDGWDVVEHVVRQSGEAVIMAFDAGSATGSVLVRPRGLKADALYGVESADFGPLGQVSGADLMDRGIEIQASSLSRGHVLILRPQGGASRRR